MQFYFIRHGQSENNALWASTGSSKGRSEDPGLTTVGLQQARAIAELLKKGNPRGGRLCEDQKDTGFGITHLYCSLMLRAVQTGSIIAETLGIQLKAKVDLHEQGGIYLENEATGIHEPLPGKDRAYFKANYPSMILPTDFIESGWWNRRPVEKGEESLQRARRFLSSLREKHGDTDDHVAVISHGGFYNDIFAALLGFSQNGGWFSIFNTGITRIDLSQDRFDILYQNRTDHLTGDLIT